MPVMLQVEVARRMMFEGGGGRDEGPKKTNRRETWCPGGKAGWQAPAGAGAPCHNSPPRSWAVAWLRARVCAHWRWLSKLQRSEDMSTHAQARGRVRSS